MRNNIKNILKELEEEGWREEYLTDGEIKKIDKLLEKESEYIRIVPNQDSYTQYFVVYQPLLKTRRDSQDTIPTLTEEFWEKYGKEEYYDLEVDISVFKKLM